jgi:hypothetical protein
MPTRRRRRRREQLEAMLAAGRALDGPGAGGVPVRGRVPGCNLAVSLYFAPGAARASTVYGSLRVALVL